MIFSIKKFKLGVASLDKNKMLTGRIISGEEEDCGWGGGCESTHDQFYPISKE